jgi:hypothetical protein
MAGGQRIVGVEGREGLEVPADGGADFVFRGIVVVAVLNGVGSVGEGGGGPDGAERGGVEEAVVAGPA